MCVYFLFFAKAENIKFNLHIYILYIYYMVDDEQQNKKLGFYLLYFSLEKKKKVSIKEDHYIKM